MAAPGLELPSTKEPISSFLTRMEQKEVRCRKGCVFFGESCSPANFETIILITGFGKAQLNLTIKKRKVRAKNRSF